jgi:hypothetical protein
MLLLQVVPSAKPAAMTSALIPASCGDDRHVLTIFRIGVHLDVVVTGPSRQLLTKR